MKRIFSLILIFVFVTSLILFSCKEKRSEPTFDFHTFEMGKTVGRTAMLIYVGRHSKDTFNLQLKELLHLEDSLSNEIRK